MKKHTKYSLFIAKDKLQNIRDLFKEVDPEK